LPTDLPNLLHDVEKEILSEAQSKIILSAFCLLPSKMTFQLENIVPWGRSAQEYRQMFNLRDADLTGKILDCGGGPASFNAEMTPQQVAILSVDPIYQFTADQIAERITAVRPIILRGVEQTRDRFSWAQITSIAALDHMRMTAMQTFLADFSAGKGEGRYQAESLPNLPYPDRAFTLALSSHLLFTYSEQLDLDFHVSAITELLRVAPEVRLFPIVENFSGARSRHLEAVIAHFQSQGMTVEIVTVAYEFQKGGNQMLRLSQDKK
jgi:hypothetical protein